MKTILKHPALAAALVALPLLAPFAAWSQVSLSVTIAPPPLPYYAQPPIPGDGYIWTPGYWSWDPAAGDYDWVPGTWVLPPTPGYLWTPGYWGFFGGAYAWHRGYWGDHVGYYGGLNYGYGYGGHGYDGGRWDHGRFRYNQAVNNIPNGRVHNVYNRPVPGRPAPGRESFNGGDSHYRTPPTAAEHRFEGARHNGPTDEQMAHEHRAMTTPEQRMSNNHGMPPTAATPRPGGFGEPGAERGREQAEMRGVPGSRGAPPQVPPQGARPGGGQPQSERGGGQPPGGQPQGGRPSGGQPQGERGGGRPEGGHPGGEHH